MAKTKLIVATKNRGKTREINSLVESLGFDVCSLLDVEDVPEIIEDKDTFLGNAVKKAEIVSAHFKCAALADDSGLCVDALDGRPGVYSARYGGEGLTDTERYEKLLKELKSIEPSMRTARFKCAMAFSVPNKETVTFEGAVLGTILTAPKGENGFGYDPVFMPNGYTQSMAEIDMSVKKEISHRAKALKQFSSWIKNNLSNK